MSDEIIFRLPPDLEVKEQFVSLSQTADYGHALLGVPQAWSKSRGEGLLVAVLDTGLYMHPELQGQVYASRDFTGDGIADRHGHQTHCNGIIAAVDNDMGVVGVAPKCKLLVGKVLGNSGSGSDTWIANGIRWAADEGAHIISMSLGSSSPAPRIRDACQYAVSKGCIIFAAAGNEGPGENTSGYPGSYPECCSVGAIDSNGKLTSFSSRGKVDIAAPGANVLSLGLSNNYVRMSGTSMATPFAAGCGALVLGSLLKVNAKFPTGAELMSMFRGASVDAGPAGKDTGYGWGLMDPAFLQRWGSELPPVAQG